MPQVQHAGCKASIFTHHTAADEPNKEVGILAPPTGERRIETIDPFEVLAEATRIATAGVLPTSRFELAQGTKREPEQGRYSVEVSAPKSCQEVFEPPGFRLESAGKHAPGEGGRQQHPIAGYEISRLGEPAMGGDKIRPCDTVAIKEDAIIAGACANRAVSGLSGTKPMVLLPDMPEWNAHSRRPRLDETRGGG